MLQHAADDLRHAQACPTAFSQIAIEKINLQFSPPARNASPMREERGTLNGNQIVSEPLDLWGTISGDLMVVDGGKVYIRGAVYGHLKVAHGGRVHIYGNVSGNLVVLEGAKV